jgi:hypothetical protein
LNGGCRALSQTQLKKEAHCYLGQRGWPFILIYLGKKKKPRIGGEESSHAQCMRDYSSSLLARLIPSEAVLEHWK